MADFRRQTPAGELQISVAEITEAADPLGPRLETPLVFSIARFPFAKRKSSFPIGEPEVRIHLPPAGSLLRTCSSLRMSRKNWFVYAKLPFAGPEAVLAYLARYTHRVATANSRLVGLDQCGVTLAFRSTQA